MDVLLLLVSFVVILLGAELFTNGIEWFGHRLDLAEGAVGSVLAAVGTALPETMIPLVAILFGGAAARGESASGIGIGAILGAPFMLATLAMGVTGLAVVVRARGRSASDPAAARMRVAPHVVATDVGYFFVAYLLAVGAALLPAGADALRLLMAGVLLAIYAWYVRAHLRAEANIDSGSLSPLRLGRLDVAMRRQMTVVEELVHPRMRVITFQVVVALLLIVGGAVGFVDGVESLASGLGVAPLILALVVAPIATELPEKFNSILWVRAGKDTLAMGNITGAMVFQSCIPTSVGLAFAPDSWRIVSDSPGSLLAFASAGIAFASMAAIFLPMLRRGTLTGRGLLVGGGFYVAYLVVVLAFIAGGG